MTNTNRVMDRPVENKRELLAQLLREKAHRLAARDGRQATHNALPVIQPEPARRYEPFPLTDIQQAYWVGRSKAYELGDVSIHAYTELDCVDLNLDRLSRAWQRLVERHDMLRAIVLPDGRQQILAQVPPYEFQILDLRGQDPRAVAEQLAAIREQLSHQVMPAERWPAFDIRAILLDDRHTRVHVSIDLVHCDGGSLMILNNEWVRLYEQPDGTLPPLALSYRDYVVATSELQGSDMYQRAQAFWSQQVPTLPPAPELPVANSPKSLGRTRFCHRSARIEPEVWQRLKSQAAQLGLTPSTVLLTAYAEILAAWSKSPNLTINVTLFNRLPLHPQINDILGDFTSMILLAMNNPISETFEQRARQVQKQLWTCLEHRCMSGVQVLRKLASVQRRSSEALMPIVFTSLLNLDSQGFRPPLASLSRLGKVVYSITQTPQVWLDHQVIEDDGALVLNWDAVEDIFPDGLLDDMLEAYCRLLERLADTAAGWQDTRHTHVPAAQLAQRAALNTTDAPIPDETLHSLFTARAVQQPGHPAVITTDRQLTYHTVYRRSNQVGRRLRELGVRPDTLIAVVMDKGWEQVVATVGIHASGAAYLPVAPGLPRERRWYLLEDGQVQFVLTQSWLNETLEWPTGIQRLCLDNDELAGVDDSPLPPVQGPRDLSHVIYTSGSTGRPKGVMIEHRSVVNRLLDVNQRQAVGPEDRVLALTALHHDLSVYDIFGILAGGGTIVMPDAGRTRDPAHWVALMAREQVTIWNSVPAFLEMLVEYLEHQVEHAALLPRSLRWAILAGDWIPVTLPDRLRALVEGVQVIASGGPTETTIWDIWYPVGAVDPTWKSIPYGKPMANARYDVLNEALEPCPVWVPGELYISGAGLARGYWRDEEQTCARFLIHPRTGERIYRSGDLGRFLPDGNIEFLGREDFQVKIGGQRIELGEIEAALQQHPAVHAAVVNAVGELREYKRLVAYVVPTREHAESIHKQPQAMHGQLREEFQQYQQVEDVTLLDPIARVEFKLRQPGIRRESERPTVQLVKPVLDDTLLRAYIERRSYRAFAPEPIHFDQFSRFLSSLYHIELDGLPKYRYASAGGLYPVQTYLSVKSGRVEGLAPGTYYYHPRAHQLLLLSPDAQVERTLHAPNNRAIFDESAFSIFLVGQLSGIEPMYGKLARDFCVLEAGYVSQLLMMVAPESQIGLCPIGDMHFEPLRHLFALEDSHIFLHALLGGRIPAGQRPDWAAEQRSFRQATAQKPAMATVRQGDLAGDLRDFLKDKLPEQMIPSAFVLLDDLPLTPNGKVDRKALPEPDQALSEAEGVFIQPNTDTERTIAAIVQEVLDVEQVGIHNNFFDLGGNSVHVVQILNKLRERLQREIPITEIFRHPTIHALAAYLDRKQDEQPSFERSDERAEVRRTSLARRGTGKPGRRGVSK